MKSKAVIICIILAALGLVCTFWLRNWRADKYKVVWKAYIPGTTNATDKVNVVIYSRNELQGFLDKHPFSDEIRHTLEKVEFSKHVVCAIDDHEIVDALGKGGIGFIRVRKTSAGLSIAVLEGDRRRLLQFIEMK
jgi:hypothetical protein